MKRVKFSLIILLLFVSCLSYSQDIDKYVGIWERVVNEVMGRDFSALSSILTVQSDGTYKIKSESVKGGYRYETGEWSELKSNEIILKPLADDNDNYLEKIFSFKNKRLIQIMDKDCQELGMKVEYQKIL